MFSPPPSPLPKATDVQPSDVSMPPLPSSSPSTTPKRRRTVFLVVVTFALVLIATSTRHLFLEAPALQLPNKRAMPTPVPVPVPLKRDPSGHVKRFHHEHLKRSLDNSNDSSSTQAPTGTLMINVGLNGTPTQSTPFSLTTAPAIPETPWPVPTPFPQAFDSTLSYNFTSTACLNFFTNLLTEKSFRLCRSFGLLLAASNQFFDISKNYTELTAVIEGTCNTTPTADNCTATMDDFATQMKEDSVCAKDIKDENPLAVELFNGLVSYSVFRQAGCLINQATNSYCYVDAVVATSPADFYFYALPLGTPVPGTATPSCSSCIQSVLSLYANYATNGTLLLSKSYNSAAAMTNAKCGNQYASIVAAVSGVKKTRAFGGVIGMGVAAVVGIVIGLMSL